MPCWRPFFFGGWGWGWGERAGAWGPLAALASGHMVAPAVTGTDPDKRPTQPPLLLLLDAVSSREKGSGTCESGPDSWQPLTFLPLKPTILCVWFWFYLFQHFVSSCTRLIPLELSPGLILNFSWLAMPQAAPTQHIFNLPHASTLTFSVWIMIPSVVNILCLVTIF